MIQHDCCKPFVSIIAVKNKNTSDVLDTTVQNLLACGEYAAEAILVSQLNVCPVGQAETSSVNYTHIIPYQDKVGSAINEAVRLTKGAYICFVHGNTVVSSEQVFKLVSLLDQSDQSGLAYSPLKICQDMELLSECSGECVGQLTEFADLLYDENPHILIVCKRDLFEQLGGFDEELDIFAGRDFCLRAARHSPIFLAPHSSCAYLVDEAYYRPEYRQYLYEEEMLIKEKHVRHFLSEQYVYPSLADKLMMHHKLIGLIFKQLQQSLEQVDVAEFDKQMFMYVLMLAKSGNLVEAKNMLATYFEIINSSRNCAHLYRIILSPYLSAPPVIRPAVREKPLVSIPMALYNHGHYLEYALRSIFAQTLTDWEVVIINDGSTDNSLRTAKDLLKKYNDPRLRIVSKANEGLPKTRSRGMIETSAPYICQLDPDDMIRADYLENAVNILENEPDVGWVTPKTLVFGGSNHIAWFWDYDFVYSLIKCPSPALAVFRRSMWEDVGKYNDEMPCREDWEFWIRAGEHGWISKTMDDVYFMYRHAFRRWGELDKYNIPSKMDIFNYHPWWYKKFSEKELREIFLVCRVGEFPQEILDPGTVKKVENWKSLSRIELRALVDNIKNEFSK